MNSSFSDGFVASRRRHPVLVPTAGAIGAIGVIRSLGRAGYPVHACASSPNALGLRSRFAVRAVVHPAEHDPAFLDWLRGYVQAESISAIVPSESFYLGVRREYHKWSRYFSDAVTA